MALKRKIDKETYDKLDDALQEQYVQDDHDEDIYVLDVEGVEDPAALRRARDREKADKKVAEKENQELRKELDELKRARSPQDKQKIDDIDKIDREWKEKHERELGERDTRLSEKDAYIKRTLINTTSDTLAKEISTVPTLMATHIRERLDVDFSGDEPELIVKNKDGDQITVEQLKRELTKNPEYAQILVGNKAAGSGAPVKDQGGSAHLPPMTSETDLARGSIADTVAHMRKVKELKGD